MAEFIRTPALLTSTLMISALLTACSGSNNSSSSNQATDDQSSSDVVTETPTADNDPVVISPDDYTITLDRQGDAYLAYKVGSTDWQAVDDVIDIGLMESDTLFITSVCNRNNSYVIQRVFEYPAAMAQQLELQGDLVFYCNDRSAIPERGFSFASSELHFTDVQSEALYGAGYGGSTGTVSVTKMEGPVVFAAVMEDGTGEYFMHLNPALSFNDGDQIVLASDTANTYAMDDVALQNPDDYFEDLRWWHPSLRVTLEIRPRTLAADRGRYKYLSFIDEQPEGKFELTWEREYQLDQWQYTISQSDYDSEIASLDSHNFPQSITSVSNQTVNYGSLALEMSLPEVAQVSESSLQTGIQLISLYDENSFVSVYTYRYLTDPDDAASVQIPALSELPGLDDRTASIPFQPTAAELTHGYYAGGLEGFNNYQDGTTTYGIKAYIEYE